MCGIAGRFNYDARQPIDPALPHAMTRVMTHRGPDAGGAYLGEGVALGHRRLSIIDLSTGDQPLANEDGTIWTVFNGEIYNFAEVRRKLESHGHVFRTNTDTEVIVHGYEQWGPDAVTRFRGMFAIALWDAPKRRLLLVRDRLGVKPLYYAPLASALVFGSEIKALLQDPDVPRGWSAEALDAYLALQYVPCPQTIYDGIFKLPPAHYLIAERGAVTITRYWDLAFDGTGDASREGEYLDRLESLLFEAVKLRMISDVPLGAFLSGGIDSSLVVAAMAQASRTSGSGVVTMSVGFAEQAFNELEYARTVASHLKTEAHETIVNPDITDLLPTLAWHFDEPFADSSAVPTYYVSKAAREHVTVALSGDGGDELWAGYARHRVEHSELVARRWLGSSGTRVAGWLGTQLPLTLRGARSLRHLALAPADAYARKHAYGLFDDDVRAGLYAGDFALAVRDADPYASLRRAYDNCASPDPLDRALYVDVNTYLVDDILTKVDRMSMAVSLEARDPLLDHRLLEFAATVPTSLKLKNGRSKYLLRRLLERHVPASIVDRPKQGFAVPVGDWLRGPLSHMATDLLQDGRLRERGIFDAAAIRTLWTEHQSRERDHGHRLWSLMMLELWFRQFVDGASQPERSREAA
jgi:asparagine synthase (glutamine-hydrolysing)